MEIKSVRINEIYWSIGWNASQQANTRLREKLGDVSQYFAMLKVGNATYNWMVDAIGQWRPMGQAPDSDKALIMKKAEEVKQMVFAKLSDDEGLASKICQVPNYEEYIFFKPNAQGDIDIAITGWGFHNFKKSGPAIPTWPPVPVMHTTTIAFTADGERQPNRPFSIVTPKMRKPCTTDEQGVAVYKEYAGVHITVIDDATQRQFTFTTTDTDTEHEFDVTVETTPPPPPEPEPEPIVKCALCVMASLDGQPLAHEPVSVDYGGQHYDLSLEENGTVSLTDLDFADGICQVEVRGERRQVTMVKDENNLVSFTFETPKPVEVMARLTVLNAQGQPMPGVQVQLKQGPQEQLLELDQCGAAQFVKSAFSLSQPLSATITTAEAQQLEPVEFQLEEKENEYVLQQKAPKGGSRLKEILAALALLAVLAALLIFVFKPGLDSLSSLINKNIF